MPGDDDVAALLPRFETETDEEYAERLASMARRLEARALVERSRQAQPVDLAMRVLTIERDVDSLRKHLEALAHDVRQLDAQAQALHRDYLPAFRRDLVKEITESVRSILQEERSRPGVLAGINTILTTLSGSKYLAGGVGLLLVAAAIAILAETGYSLATEWVQVGPQSAVVMPSSQNRRSTPEPDAEPPTVP